MGDNNPLLHDRPLTWAELRDIKDRLQANDIRKSDSIALMREIDHVLNLLHQALGTRICREAARKFYCRRCLQWTSLINRTRPSITPRHINGNCSCYDGDKNFVQSTSGMEVELSQCRDDLKEED